MGEFRGRAFCCFEYNTRNSTSGPDAWRYHAVFAVTMPMPAPRMVIKKPRAVDKVNARADALFGGGKVMELGDPAFDEAFRPIANDEEFARSALTGPMACDTRWSAMKATPDSCRPNVRSARWNEQTRVPEMPNQAIGEGNSKFIPAIAQSGRVNIPDAGRAQNVLGAGTPGSPATCNAYGPPPS